DLGSGLHRDQSVDAVEIRRGKSPRPAQARRGRRRAASLSQGHHGSGVSSCVRILRRDRRDESALPKDLRTLDEIPQGRIPLVSRREKSARHLLAAASAGEEKMNARFETKDALRIKQRPPALALPLAARGEDRSMREARRARGCG